MRLGIEPLSIATGYFGLASAITTICKAILELASEVRDAKDKLGRVLDKLTSLKVLLKHIANNIKVSKVRIAEQLKSHIKGIVANCKTKVEEIGKLIEKCSARRRGTRSVA